MTTVHAWFSMAAALVGGSSVYRKLSGATVNVTRTSPDNEIRGFYRHTEKYVGEVIRSEDGGCVGPRSRVDGITSESMRDAKDRSARESLDSWENDGGSSASAR
jgi:hypothetical protein